MDTKSLGFKQVHWTQKLSYYHFQINYSQSKSNGAVNALSQYLQQSAEKEKTFCTKNIKILHCLQSSLARVSDISINLS